MSEEIPPSIKSPWSLKADYANPLIYGWVGVVFGILGLVVGIVAFVVLGTPSILLLAVLGGVILLVGVILIKKGE